MLFAAACVIATMVSPAHADDPILPLHTSVAGDTLAHSGGGSVSAAGAFNTSVPLELPPVRGDLPVPLRILYRGDQRVGSAGLSWDVPIPHIVRSDNISRRKPRAVDDSGAPPWPAERLFLSLGGSTTLLAPTATSGTYRALVNDTSFEVVGAGDGAWTARDADGRQWIFKSLNLDDVDYSVLVEVVDAAGANRVKLNYYAFEHRPVDGDARMHEVLLKSLEYNHHPTTGCPKHRVNLGYAKLAADGQPPLAISDENGRPRPRTRRLTSVTVHAHGEGSCADDRPSALRAYELGYENESLTGLGRLAWVDVRAEGVLPFDVQGARLPVVRFAYGEPVAGKSLSYGTPRLVVLPNGPTSLSWSLSSFSRQGSAKPQRLKYFLDLTGDNLPDFVHPHANFFTSSNKHLYLAPQQLTADSSFQDSSFWAVDNPGSFPLPTAEYAARSDFFDETGVLVDIGFTPIWRQVLDWNGDGRPDVVSSFGKNPAGQQHPDYWTVWINRPGAIANKPEWEELNVDVTQLRALVNTHHDLTITGYSDWNLGNFLPVSRSHNTFSQGYPRCYHYVQGGSPGQFYRQECDSTPPAWFQRGNVVEWELRDVNGDGLPDFLLNSEKISAQASYAPACPEFTSTVPEGCEGSIDNPRVNIELPSSNQILVSYNTGVGLDGANVPRPLWQEHAFPLRAAPCGLGRRVKGLQTTDGTTQQLDRETCGFADLNGDGLEDYFETAEGSPAGASPTAYLSTGLPQGLVDYDSVVLAGAANFAAWEALRSVPVPGPIDVTFSGHKACEQVGAPPDTQFGVVQYSTLHDVTGDGVLDYVFFGTLAGGRPLDVGPAIAGEARGWHVMAGRGTSFADAIPIETTSEVPFGLLYSVARCDGSLTQLRRTLIDLDGDGFSEIADVRSDGNLLVSALAPAGRSTPVFTANRLTEVGNGWGAVVRIEYANAKVDPYAAHGVPMPEIVVSTTTQVASRVLQQAYLATRYAYGDPQRLFNPLLARWQFVGYRRRVALRGELTADRQLRGTGVVEDYVTPGERAAGIDRLALSGRLKDVFRLEGTLPGDPRELLAADLTTHAQVRGRQHLEHAIVVPDAKGAEPGLLEECADRGPYAAQGGLDPALCRRIAYSYVAAETAWRGDAPPPAATAVSQTTINAPVDAFGRNTKISYLNDDARDDDDVCHELVYATPIAGAQPIRSVLASERITDCAKEPTTLARTRYRHDNLPEGQVSVGRLTSTVVERRDAQTGVLLGELHTGTTTYDALGNVRTWQATRADDDGPTTRTQSLEYDPYWLVPTRVVDAASDVPVELVTSYEVDPRKLTAIRRIGPNGSVTSGYRDGFGRLRVATSRAPGGAEFVRSTVEYLGEEPGAVVGRQVKQRRYSVDVPGGPDGPTGSFGADQVRESTEFLDDLGRLRYREERLGNSYAGAVMVHDWVDYDAFGRVRFSARPFEWGEFPGNVYGRAYLFNVDGSLKCEADASRDAGPWTVPNEALQYFPTCYTYRFEARESVLERRGPNDVVAGPQQGAFDEVRVSAIGRAYRASRRTSTATLELSTFSYDRLGQRVGLRRAAEPTLPGPVPMLPWTLRYDSLGQLLESDEPGQATREYLYDDWGELVRESHIDSTSTTSIRRASEISYDGFSRPTVKQLADISLGSGATTIAARYEYFYDLAANDDLQTPGPLLGQLSHTFDGQVTAFFGYDAEGRASSVGYRDDVTGETFRERYVRGADDAVTEVHLGLPDGEMHSARYAYDSAGRVDSIYARFGEDADEERVWEASAIDVRGRITRVEFGNGVSLDRGFKPTLRRDLHTETLRPTAQTRTTTYRVVDGANQVREREDNVLLASGFSSSKRHVYGYDALHRLARSTTVETASNGTTAVLFDTSFVHDGLGNLRSRTNHLSGISTNFLRDALVDPDRLCRVSTGRLPIGTCTYEYDEVGNTVVAPRLGGATRSLAYDPSGRVVSVDSTESIQLGYDAFGRLARLRTTGGSITDDREERRYGDLIERRSVWAADGESQIYVTRVLGPQGVVVEQRGDGEDARRIYGHGDGIGQDVFTDEHGLVVQAVENDPFGAVLSDTGEVGSASWSGQQWNVGEAFAGQGLTLLGARIYDTDTGRFLQRDPLLRLASASRMHPYGFPNGDPINFMDPLGLTGEEVIGEWHTDDSGNSVFEYGGDRAGWVWADGEATFIGNGNSLITFDGSSWTSVPGGCDVATSATCFDGEAYFPPAEYVDIEQRAKTAEELAAEEARAEIERDAILGIGGPGGPPPGGMGGGGGYLPMPRPPRATKPRAAAPRPAPAPRAPAPAPEIKRPPPPGGWVQKAETLHTGGPYQTAMVPGRDGSTYRVPFANPNPRGNKHVDFDDYDPNVHALIDYKTSVFGSRKSVNQAQRQRDAAAAVGATVIWRVPTRAAQLGARAFLIRNKISGITVELAPHP